MSQARRDIFLPSYLFLCDDKFVQRFTCNNKKWLASHFGSINSICANTPANHNLTNQSMKKCDSIATSMNAEWRGRVWERQRRHRQAISWWGRGWENEIHTIKIALRVYERFIWRHLKVFSNVSSNMASISILTIPASVCEYMWACECDDRWGDYEIYREIKVHYEPYPFLVILRLSFEHIS